MRSVTCPTPSSNSGIGQRYAPKTIALQTLILQISPLVTRLVKECVLCVDDAVCVYVIVDVVVDVIVYVRECVYRHV